MRAFNFCEKFQR